MQKKPIFDMVPRKRIAKPAESTAEKIRVQKPAEKPRTPEKKMPAYEEPRRESRPREKRKMGIFSKLVLAILLIGGAFFGIMSYFASAEITVARKSETAQIQTDLTALAGPGGDLSYKSMTIEKDATTTVPASQEQDVESKAVGTVIIYNNYSAAPYRLIKNTRLESSGNLIFKISDTVVVPGKKTANGVSTPGSAAVSIFADSDGPEYNIGFADFTLPGLKDTPEYSGFYARSKTAIAGGWSGKKSIASDSDIAKAETALQASLKSGLEAEALSEIPDGYVLLKGLYATGFDAPAIGSGDKSATVSLHATFRGALFSKADLSKIIIQKSGTKISGGAEVSGIESLQAIPKIDAGTALASSSPIALTLKGTPAIRATIDTILLQKALAGSPRSSLSEILQGFPGISSASVSIIPFWNSSFPSDTGKIRIVVQ